MLLRRTRLNRWRRRRQFPYPAAQDTHMAWCKPSLSVTFIILLHTHTPVTFTYSVMHPSNTPTNLFFSAYRSSRLMCFFFLRQNSGNLISPECNCLKFGTLIRAFSVKICSKWQLDPQFWSLDINPVKKLSTTMDSFPAGLLFKK